MMALPALTPVTVPDTSTLAVPGALLPHTPPRLASCNVVVAPAHSVPAPLIGRGGLLTVTVVVAIQPVGKV
jgi:hypothetical protein